MYPLQLPTPPPDHRTPLEHIIDDARDWCNGRMWFVRLPLWLYLAYVGYNQFVEPLYYASLFSGINTGIHEGGHLLFRFGGEFICVAGGTIAQLAAPIITIYIFYTQRDFFGISVALGWLSTNLIGVGVYMADAQDMALPLITVGGGNEGGIVTHDWRYLFSKVGLLELDKTIGLLTRGLATLSMLLCLAAGAWLIWEMYNSDGKRKMIL